MTETDDFDYSDVTDNSVDGSLAKKLTELARKQKDAELAVAQAEAALEEAKLRLKAVQDVEIPTFMDQQGLTEFTTESGLKVKIRKKHKASITDATRPAAIKWLRDNNLDRLIRNEFSVSFQKGEDKKALKLASTLRAIGANFKSKENVHHSTLSAFVTERLEKGEAVPDKAFNVFTRVYAEIKAT